MVMGAVAKGRILRLGDPPDTRQCDNENLLLKWRVELLDVRRDLSQ
jgi:hypothetical protein